MKATIFVILGKRYGGNVEEAYIGGVEDSWEDAVKLAQALRHSAVEIHEFLWEKGRFNLVKIHYKFHLP